MHALSLCLCLISAACLSCLSQLLVSVLFNAVPTNTENFKGAGGFMKLFNCLHANCVQLLCHTFVILCILKLSIYGGHCLLVKQLGQEKEESKE